MVSSIYLVNIGPNLDDELMLLGCCNEILSRKSCGFKDQRLLYRPPNKKHNTSNMPKSYLLTWEKGFGMKLYP
jgi:hypothetical protein